MCLPQSGGSSRVINRPSIARAATVRFAARARCRSATTNSLRRILPRAAEPRIPPHACCLRPPNQESRPTHAASGRRTKNPVPRIQKMELPNAQDGIRVRLDKKPEPRMVRRTRRAEFMVGAGGRRRKAMRLSRPSRRPARPPRPPPPPPPPRPRTSRRRREDARARQEDGTGR